MAEVLRWGDVSFFAEAGRVRGVTNVEITSGSETEDKKKDGQKYVSRKAGNGHQVDMTAVLDGRLGEDVYRTAAALQDMAQEGRTGYLYTRYGKLFPCMFMLVAAKTGDVQINPGGGWLSANVALTLKQCDKPGASASSSSGRKVAGTAKKQSVKTGNWLETLTETVQEKVKGVSEWLQEAKTYGDQKLADLKKKAALGQATGNVGGLRLVTQRFANSSVRE